MSYLKNCPRDSRLLECRHSCSLWAARRWHSPTIEVGSPGDIDALFVPAPEVRQIAEEMSIGHGLEPDWLNDAAKGFLPGPDEQPCTVFESASLLVQIPSPQYLLAMKLHASRDDRDLDDAAILCNTLEYTTAQECIDLLTNTYPVSQLLPRHHYIAEEVATRSRFLSTGATDD